MRQKMKLAKNFNRVFCVSMFLLLTACGGLGKSVYHIKPEQLLEVRQNDKLNFNVVLRLSDQMCHLKWFIGSGLTFYADFGEAFCLNAKTMAQNTFQQVSVNHNTDKNHPTDFYLTPKVVKISKTTGGDSSNPITIEMTVQWTLSDINEKIVWADLVKGIGRGKMGGPISYKSNSIDQVRLALKDMFENTQDRFFATTIYFDPKQIKNRKNKFRYERDGLVYVSLRPKLEAMREYNHNRVQELKSFKVNQTTFDEFQNIVSGPSSILYGHLGAVEIFDKGSTRKYVMGQPAEHIQLKILANKNYFGQAIEWLTLIELKRKKPNYTINVDNIDLKGLKYSEHSSYEKGIVNLQFVGDIEKIATFIFKDDLLAEITWHKR